MTDQAVLDRLDRIAELLAAALERPAVTAPEAAKTGPTTGVKRVKARRPAKAPKRADKGHSSPVVSDLPTFQALSKAVEPVAAPSKEALCRQWFEAHPEDRQRTGRELAAIAKPQGVTISHVTWNKVKKELS